MELQTKQLCNPQIKYQDAVDQLVVGALNKLTLIDVHFFAEMDARLAY